MKRHVQQGFTIVELLIVLLFVALLASITTPLLMSPMERAEESVLKEDLYVIRKAIDDYYSDHGRYPVGLDELVEKRYIRRIPIDPMTNSASSWVGVRSTEDQNIEGIFDVHSGTDKKNREGQSYKEW